MRALGAARVVFIAVCLAWPAAARAETLTLPADQRPDWLARDGIVMAGSWEPLLFRVRRDGSSGYTPTADQRAAYLREHSPEMVDRLKALGVNFVMMHCYKGGGMEAERQSMDDAVRFAELCHQRGLRVGVYVCSGAFLWELLYKEVPQADDWVVRDVQGNPRIYGGRVAYRYYWNRNHPDAAAYHRRIVRFAVEEIKTDLIHFDNYVVGPAYDACSVARFRRFLASTFKPGEISAKSPPAADSPPLLRFAWHEFCCRSLADSYLDMSRYARTLRPDVLLECNPGGVRTAIRAPVDHGRLMQGGEAIWDESKRCGFDGGKLQSHIQTYKAARGMGNMAFCYTTTPLEMAESMAFNSDCLGAICWFEYGTIKRRPGSDEPMSTDLGPFIDFFHRRRGLLRNADVVADVAVLRSFPSQVFADAREAQLTARVEDALIRDRACFQILYDHQLENLPKKPYRVLVLAGCVAMGDREINRIRQYVKSGGRLCLIGTAATHDQWMRPRKTPALDDLPASRVQQASPDDDPAAAIRRALGGEPSLSIAAKPGLCAELTEQPGRRLVHLVNYRADGPIEGVTVRVRTPAERLARSVVLAGPGHEADIELPFSQEGGTVSFTVPKVDVYEIAVISVH